MSDVISTEIVKVDGHYFKVERIVDNDQGAPWENSDGHGEVRKVHQRHASTSYDGDKRSGEIPLNDPDRGCWQYYYDWQAAVKTARKEWGIGDEKLAELTAKLGRAPTKGEIAVAAVKSDVKFLRGWCNDYWHYIGVEVTHLIRSEMDDDIFDDEDIDCFEEGESDALWGVESNGDYWREVQAECIANLMHGIRKEEEDAKAEAAERQFWEERDVCTV